MTPLEVLDPQTRRKARKARFPEWVEPMKATLVHESFSDPDWIFEPKLDGERCLAYVRRGAVTMMSRNKKSIGHSYPEIVGALSGAAFDVVVDGEVVAEKDGIASFGLLQQRMHVQAPTKELLERVPVVYNVFDIVYCDGSDLSQVPLLARKKVLRKTLRPRKAVRLVKHRVRDGDDYFEEMCSTPGQEGVIAKRAESPYQHSRSKDWLKFKCSLEQEFVIGGFTDPQGSRSGFGALLVGYYEGRDLRYAGKVGTGFNQQLLRILSEELAGLERPDPPFADRGIG
ncbi:MAG TPA: non-homologous end-joining DNA ligase, partial [Actinomycetota bacterium]|nr:non-homologous end-joining DNA ligase [Actinomycetota bacterium]